MMLNINELINKLQERFNNQLPTKEVNSFELGKLIGNQEVIHYILTVVEQDNYKKINK